MEKIKSLGQNYVLHLYFAGRTPRTNAAIENLKDLCSDRLAQRCKVKFIDICRNPALAKREQIVASPTLVRKFPFPERRVIGDLSDFDRILSGLDLK